MLSIILEVTKFHKMIDSSTGFQQTISHFSFAFRKDVWFKVEQLLLRVIICPGSRTVCNILRSIGLSGERNFPKYHRVLSQDKWSTFQLSGILLSLLIRNFTSPTTSLAFGLEAVLKALFYRKVLTFLIFEIFFIKIENEYFPK